MPMKTLLHSCCAPCSINCVKMLRKEKIEPVMYWYNPNIHPYKEYESRKKGIEDLSKLSSIELISEDNYGLREFIKLVYPNFDDRCRQCYRIRLEKTAEYAKINGFESFSTTLLISPYQKHKMIMEEARRAADIHGVKFLYRDFRPGFREGQNAARVLGIYMQKYCGCIFSEEERYMKR